MFCILLMCALFKKKNSDELKFTENAELKYSKWERHFSKAL